MILLAHAADHQLDASATIHGRVLRNERGENVRWLDRVRCFESFAEGAIRERCDLAVVSGDLFDHPRPTPLEYAEAERVLDRLAQCMPVVLIADNHGQAESPTERHAIAPLAGRHRDLHVVMGPDVIHLTIGGEVMQVACLPTPRRSVLIAKDEMQGKGPEEVNAIISAKLRVILEGLKDQCDPTQIRILVAHLLVREANLGSIDTPSSAVWVSVKDLDGWNYVALGDVHKRQAFLGGRARYPGSTDRIDFGEELYRPGWLSVQVAPGQTPIVEEHDTPARRYWTMPLSEMAQGPSADDADAESARILRVTGEVTEEEYDHLARSLARWRSIPTFRDQLEVTRVVRSREAGMTADLSTEAGLTLWAKSEGREEELPELLAAHREVAG